MNKFFGWITDHAATILSWCATAGTVGGAVAAAKAAQKARERIDKYYEEKTNELIRKVDEQFCVNDGQVPEGRFSEYCEALDAAFDKDARLTAWEKVKAAAPAFVWAALIEGITIGCIQGADILNRKNIGQMSRTITGLKEALALGAAGAAVYKENVARIDPTVAYAAEKMATMEEADKQEGRTAWDEPQTFYIDGQPEFFERTMLQVFQAEVALNKAFALLGSVTMNDFYRLLDLPEIPDGDQRGWEGYLGEVYYGYRWIDFRHPPYQTPDGMWITEIEMPFEPHPLDEEEVEAELDEAVRGFQTETIDANRLKVDVPWRE